MATPDVQASDAKINPEDLQRQILERINQNRSGAYQEGAIATGLQELKNLEGMAKSGQISQDDFVNIGQSVRGVLQPIGDQSMHGKGPATAINNAGWQDMQTNFRNLDIYKGAKEILGRDIDANEFAKIAPRFGTGNATDMEQGRAYLAEIAGQEAKSPQALGKKAPEFAGKVNETFQSLLGRDATANESDYYGRLLATGDITPYEVEQYVKSGKEFQGGEDKRFREELSGELGGYREEALGDASEAILSRYKRTTGPHQSSNLDFAMADAAKDLEGETERYLSGLSADMYGGNKATARADYETMLNQFLSGQDYSKKRSDSYTDYLTGRAGESVDYNRQMEDYIRYLNQQPQQKKKGMGSLVGGLLGAGVGAFGGPAGISAGFSAGTGAGGMYDYLVA